MASVLKSAGSRSKRKVNSSLNVPSTTELIEQMH